DAGGLAEGGDGDAGKLVARLERLAEAALGPDGAGARARRDAGACRAGAGRLRQGPLRPVLTTESPGLEARRHRMCCPVSGGCPFQWAGLSLSRFSFRK